MNEASWIALSAYGTVGATAVAVLALIVSIVTAARTSEPRVRWIVEKTDKEYQYRVRNDSSRWIACVTKLDDSFEGESAVKVHVTLPVDIEPQNWIPLQSMQYLNREHNAVDLEWRQKRLGRKWLRPIVRRARLFL